MDCSLPKVLRSVLPNRPVVWIMRIILHPLTSSRISFVCSSSQFYLSSSNGSQSSLSSTFPTDEGNPAAIFVFIPLGNG